MIGYLLLWACSNSTLLDTGDVDPCSISLRESFVLQYAPCPDGVCSVIEGNFIMGEGNPDSADQCPSRTVYLSSFSIDETEVTRFQYKQCVDVGTCAQVPDCPSQAHITNVERLPQTCVTWEQAQAYCLWRGGSLPTEAQWEKSARGTTGASWSWGQAPPSCGVANFRYSAAYCAGGPVEVGSYRFIDPLTSDIPTARSPFGLLDTVGNVWEWTADWYDALYFRHATDIDPQGPELCSIDIDSSPDICTQKVIKGGAYNTLQDVTMGNARGFLAPELYDNNIGFRCAYP